MANRLNNAAPENIQLLRMMLQKLQKLVGTSSTGPSTDEEGIVVGTGIYQKDITDNTVFTTAIRLRKIDEQSSETYLGYSAIGTADNSNQWVLVKITSSGSVTSFEFAIDSWNNRTTASYS